MVFDPPVSKTGLSSYKRNVGEMERMRMWVSTPMRGPVLVDMVISLDAENNVYIRIEPPNMFKTPLPRGIQQ